MLRDLSLPEGLSLIRTTDELTAATMPRGLRRAHHLAADHWGLLRVFEGELTFVLEGSGESRTLTAGETQVIEPALSHHVEPGPSARFAIEFHR